MKALARALVVSTLSFAVPTLSTAAVTLSAARIWPAAEYTRITLEASEAISHRVTMLQSPPRLIVDLDEVEGSTVLDGLVARISPNDPHVRTLRAGRFKPGAVRLVFDLKVDVRPQSFLLRPVGDYGYRLVLDLYPVQAQDPILELLNDTAASGRDVASSAPLAAIDGVQAQPAPAPPGSLTGLEGADRPPGGRDSTATPGRPAPVREPTRIALIAIDAGHGGEDPGARGRLGTQEKDVTLAIARRLKELVDATDGMRSFLVRDGDYFVPLHQRVARARAAQADVFVSIHADAFIKPHARGSSVFALSERGATSAAARWLAKRENDADLIGGVNIDVPDPMLKQVLLDLSQTATINDGLKLGRAVLHELGQLNTLHKHAVEQAGFAVLKAPDIPSILVETAFISNPEEEERLRDDNYQKRMAASLLAGLQRYLARHSPRVPGVEAATAEGIAAQQSNPQAGVPLRPTTQALDTARQYFTDTAQRGNLMRVSLQTSTPSVAPKRAVAAVPAPSRARTESQPPGSKKAVVHHTGRSKAQAGASRASKTSFRPSATGPSACEAGPKLRGRCEIRSRAAAPRRSAARS